MTQFDEYRWTEGHVGQHHTILSECDLNSLMTLTVKVVFQKILRLVVSLLFIDRFG